MHSPTALDDSARPIQPTSLRGWKTLLGAMLSCLLLFPVIGTHVGAPAGSLNAFESLDTVLFTLACWIASTVLLVISGFAMLVRFARRQRVIDPARLAFVIALGLHGLWWAWFIIHELNRPAPGRTLHGR